MERIEGFRTNTRKLGRWTESRDFEVRGHSGSIVLDLRALPEGDVEVRVDIERSSLKLLVPDNATVDQWDLRLTGRSKVTDYERPQTQDGPRIRLVGEVRKGEVRVNRGGVAVLSAMLTREFVEDCRRAHRDGDAPTVHDPVAV
ncbi:hypothetical protein ACIBG8_25585 [Nonomuraea sp. NPDC050556]|uniref:hypothetical protein n=1 Tax=Nonomuraea sp. NPDC050556 TaxID=3364369 RepID=UPI003789B694